MRRRRTYLDYVRDMFVYARQAEEFLRGVDLEQFRQDVKMVLAVTRALEVVGEAARQLPAALRQRYPEVPWSKVIGMRNILMSPSCRCTLVGIVLALRFETGLPERPGQNAPR